MAFSNYADLKSRIANWLNRTALVDRIPEFITLAHSRIHYGSLEAPFQSEPLRIRAMESSVSTTLSEQYTQLPDRFLQARRLFLSGDPVRKLDPISTEQFWDTWVSSQTGTPKQFTIEGENILVGPTPDSSYSAYLLYYAAFEAFSDETDTNWLLLNAPGAYLWGALIEAYAFSRNIEQQENAHKKFVGIINSLNLADKKDRFPTPWIIRNDTGNP